MERKNKGRNFTNKSQAALEFIATYMWAVLVILIMIGALAYFGVLSPSKILPERCTMGQGITCINSRLGRTDIGTGALRLRLRNDAGDSVVITFWNTSSDSSIPFTCAAKPATGTWVKGEVKDFEFTNCNNDEAGIILGEKAKVNVMIRYYQILSSIEFSKEIQGEIYTTVTSLESLLTQFQCSDGIDNDHNGCIDYAGGDTGCSSPSDTGENNGACPNGGGAGLSLYCFVSTNCPDTAVFRMSDLKDAHAEIQSLSNYDYKACCRSANDTLSNSCISPQAIPLHLSANTDAHAEKSSQSNYAINACLSGNTKTISCSYAANCPADEACLATISADTDAHVGDCETQPFANKICCKLI